MNLLQTSKEFGNYFLTGTKARHIATPELAKLFDEKSIDPESMRKDFILIDSIREVLLKDHRTIEVDDHGAGSGATERRRRKISEIARKSSGPRKFSILQYRMIKHFNPSVILELGTSFGFTSSLFALAAPDAEVITVEGCSNTAGIAEQNFHHLGISNIKLINGVFDEVLDDVLKQYDKVDYLYFDGNHRMIPTLNYFLKALPFAGERSVFVIDDIRWSEQMAEAWREIIRHPRITVSIDLFTSGILLFDKSFTRQHLQLRY